MSEISTKPYMLRAIYEWCTDSGYTPHIAIAVDARTRVPPEFVKNGEIVLNISFGATSGLKMDNDMIQFNARFGGISREIVIPVENVLAIYANENGQGMMFEAPLTPTIDEPATVKKDSDSKLAARNTLKSVPTTTSTTLPDNGDGNSDPPKKGGRPTMIRIK